MKGFTKKIYFYIGTTAELIKLAPIIKELERRKIEYKVITSGQTRVNFGNFKGYFSKKDADIVFKEKVNKSSAILFIWWTIQALIGGLFKLKSEFKGLNKKNSLFIIYGDPVSTSIGAIIAWFYGLKIVHLESGDWSFNILEPFPEEIGRYFNVWISDILFPPNEWAKKNLKHVNKPKISTRFNTLLEVFDWIMNKRVSVKSFGLKKYYLLILHRQEHMFFRRNWSRDVLKLIVNNSKKNLDIVVFDNPLTLGLLESLDLPQKIRNKIKKLPTVSYSDFLNLMKNSEYIATDGATNQLEAYLMGKPCLVLRDYTEQIEGLNENVVLYKSQKTVALDFLAHYQKYQTKRVKSTVKPSKIVVDYLVVD